MSDEGSASISPTAHYTSYVWARNGLSHPALTTARGRLFFHSLRGPVAAAAAAGAPTLEGYLMGRHRLIDELLEAAIAEGRVSQVIEVAAGLSPRGWRFAARHGEGLTYVEADLPEMAARKRKALEEIGSLAEHHRVVEIDALRDEGEASLAALAARLDPAKGTAVISEGLLSYLGKADVLGLWRRVAATLAGFPAGLYLSDLHLEAENPGVATRGFIVMLSMFVRGRVAIHFADQGEAAKALREAGFADAALRSPLEIAERIGVKPRDARAVHVIEART
jgi:O-methyltransferase involved in polyketide biosynthesis